MRWHNRLRGSITLALLAALAFGTAEAQHPSKASVRSRIKSKSAQVKRLRQAELRLANGVWLRYIEQGDPAGHPVILLHGHSGWRRA